MELMIENLYEGDDFKEIFSFHYKETARRVIKEALRTEGCPYDAEVSLSIVGLSGIQELNREMRGIDKATDVLSFPMTAYDVPADFDSLDENDVDAFDPENGCLVLGDIVIAAPKVKEQAASYGHSSKREWAFLIAHSMLHLMGYDHMTDEERLVMEEKQEQILQNLNIKREVTK